MIERRLENLLALDYPADRLEIVVTSDASTDRTDELVEAVAAREPRVRLIRCPRGGKVAAQDRAVRETEGEIVAFSDANATWAPDALAQARRARSPTPRSRTSAAGSCSPTPTARTGRASTGATRLAARRRSRALGSVTGGNGSIYAVRRSDYVEVDPRFGHDLSLPYLMVQHGRRAVYEPEALAFEKPTPANETEYRRKVRMFEHCWLIVLRGRMLRRLPPGYLVEIVSHRHLRYASGLLHLVLLGDERRARRDARRDRLRRRARRCSSRSSLLAAARRRARRATTRSSPGRRSSRSGTTCAAACRRPGTRRRGRRGDERRRPSRRRRHSRAVADQDARQPLPRRRADALPDPAVSARPGRGAGAARPRLQLGALDDRRRRAPATARRGSTRRRRRSAPPAGSPSSSASSAEYVVGDARELPVPGRLVRRRLLVQRPPAPGEGRRADGRRRDPPRAPAGRDGLDRDAERARAAQPRRARCGAASRRAAARTSATGRSPELRATFARARPGRRSRPTGS